MESKERCRLGRSEMAQRLRQIADMVENGSVVVGNTAVMMPDDVEYKMEIEEEAHEGKVEIEAGWRR